MNKEELRALYKQIRLRMTDSEVSTKSRIITRKLINEIDWKEYQYVCLFEPIRPLKEVEIRPLINRLQKYTKLRIQVIQPNKAAKLPAKKFDLIVVPILAFDDDNYRLGWGGGWYDRFLADQSQARKIGVGYQNGHINKLPREAHDIALDSVITEI
jgi:5-formyltetrahydrofolate cyclo-ligase